MAYNVGRLRLVEEGLWPRARSPHGRTRHRGGLTYLFLQGFSTIGQCTIYHATTTIITLCICIRYRTYPLTGNGAVRYNQAWM